MQFAIAVLLPLLLQAGPASGRWDMEANSGNDGGVFVLNSRTGTARYFGADFEGAGGPMRFQKESSKEEAPGTFVLSVNSGSMGGCFIADTRTGKTKYFKTSGQQQGPNFTFAEGAEAGPVGSYAIEANSGDSGGVYILDARTGVARLYFFDGAPEGNPMRFQGEEGGTHEPGRYAVSANAGSAEGLFILDTKTGVCRYFHSDGKQWGKTIEFGGSSGESGPGRFAVSANSGEAGGVFILNTLTGLCRYFDVEGRKRGKDLRFAKEAPEKAVTGRYALSANSGEAGGVFLVDSIAGVARFLHVSKGEQFGRDIKFTEEPVIHKKAGRFRVSANSGGWGGVFLQDTESGVVRYFRVDGKQVGEDINE